MTLTFFSLETDILICAKKNEIDMYTPFFVVTKVFFHIVTLEINSFLPIEEQCFDAVTTECSL